MSVWDNLKKDLTKQDDESERKTFLKAVHNMRKEDKKLADLLKQTGEQLKKKREAEEQTAEDSEETPKDLSGLDAVMEKLPPYTWQP